MRGGGGGGALKHLPSFTFVIKNMSCPTPKYVLYSKIKAVTGYWEMYE